MGTWLGPLVIVAAVLTGGIVLRLVDRYEGRAPARASRRLSRPGVPAPSGRLAPPWSEKAARLFLASGSIKWR